MPNWGLSQTQRRTRPWGIDESWLEPAKTITDPVHGDVYLNKLEAAIANSRPMQRLRGVRQLGTTHLIYPGATHSRFSHALGTLRAAQDLIDAVIDGLSGPRPARGHLLREWEAEGKVNPGVVDSPTVFDLRVAEATVLARLGGLLHDLCHVPMGHTVEDDLEILTPHDKNTVRFERLWAQLPDEVRIALGEELTSQLRPLIMSKVEGADPPAKYPFVMDIVGNTICADLMDYLRRDHHATGLPIALGDRFVNEFFVTSGEDRIRPGRMAVHIDRNGHLRHDVVTELVKYLRYRYELSERVLYHHAKVSADAMLGKLLDMWRDALWAEQAEKSHPHLFTNRDVIADVGETRLLVRNGHGQDAVDRLDALVEARVEDQFLNWDDDGLLTDLKRSTSMTAKAGGPGAARLAGIANLSEMVLARELFKTLGRADSEADLAVADKIHKTWGSSEKRRELEEGAARFAGITPRWRIVLWVPGPKMRPKPAGVLVEREGRVAALADMPESVSGDAKSIVEQHRRLWGVAAYVHSDVRAPLQRAAALAWLRDATGLAFRDEEGRLAPSVEDLLVQVLTETTKVESTQVEKLRELAGASAKGGEDTFAGRLSAVDATRVAVGIGQPDPMGPNDLAAIGWPVS